jgi:hypothetical protein
LHQELVYSFDFLVNKDNIDTKKWKKNKCYLTIGDSIQDTSYIDVDELSTKPFTTHAISG